MKKGRWLVLALLTAVLIRAEPEGTSIDRLEPVELVFVQEKEGMIWIETDTGAKGVGGSVEKAVENLRSAASAEVFLDTARYLLLGSTARDALPELYRVLNPGTRVCMVRGEAELSPVVSYLNVHTPACTLRALRAGVDTMQILYYKGRRGQLVE